MINIDQDLFPYCIVWTILPCITWLIPIIGHVGICDSSGIVYDFLGYRINIKSMAFGRPIKYHKLKIDDPNRYAKCLQQANLQFEQQGHDLCCNNCHHHVARVLNLYRYEGKDNWNQINIWWMCIYGSNYVNTCGVIKTYAPFLIIAMVIFGIILLSKHI